jgi:hypothetical protein
MRKKILQIFESILAMMVKTTLYLTNTGYGTLLLNTSIILIFLEDKKGKGDILHFISIFCKLKHLLWDTADSCSSWKGFDNLKYAHQPGTYNPLGSPARRGWLYLQSENQNLLTEISLVPGRDYGSLTSHLLNVCALNPYDNIYNCHERPHLLKTCLFVSEEA